ncbi:hypothetical protein MNV49_002455 [Pseudohyphozyma bogoriensis]|nr:hypothetical protein MNV49_002455 [Pseudohyphozyma bogoriensis]
MSRVSALSPVDPSTVSEAEGEETQLWLLRKLSGTIPGRIAVASLQTVKSLSVVCLSPWGDGSPFMLPCIRLRDIAVHTAIAATGGTAEFAAPLAHTFADTVVGALGDSIVVELSTAVAWDVGNEVATDLIFHEAGNKVSVLVGSEHEKLTSTTGVKSMTITLKYQHSTLTDAVLGFFRASTVVHQDPSLFASIGDYLSWFNPYLQASARRPIIPRRVAADVVFCHGPFLQGDYSIAQRLASESLNLINLVDTSSSSTPPSLVTPPRSFLITVIALSPHRLGMWTSSGRPGESVIQYHLLNGCPAVVVPVLPGSPLLAWNTLTLETLHKEYLSELDADGNVKPDSEKVKGLIDSLYEFVSLCVDWERVRTPSTEADADARKRYVRGAIGLVVQGKRIAAQNKGTVNTLRIGFAVSNIIYLLHLFIFRSGRTWTRLFYFSVTDVLAIVLWNQLEGMAKRGDDLSAAGLTSYMFDVIYVTWFVHVGTALITTKFWLLYLSIPAYAIYRLGKFAIPYVWPSGANRVGGAPRKVGGQAGAGAAAEDTTEPLSKRQEKLKKRQEKGARYVMQR